MKKTNVFIFNSMFFLNTANLIEPLRHFLEPLKEEIKLINFTTEEVHKEFLNARSLINIRRTIRQNPTCIIVILVTELDLAHSNTLPYCLILPTLENLKFAQNPNFKGKIILCSYLPIFIENEVNKRIFSAQNDCLRELSEIYDEKDIKTYDSDTKSYTIVAGNTLSFVLFHSIVQTLRENLHFEADRQSKIFPIFNPRELLLIRSLCADKLKFESEGLKVTELKYCKDDDWELHYHLAFMANKSDIYDL
jgi:hypothetical protein